jgi:hypothetical protein
MSPNKIITAAEEARQYAIEWSGWIQEQDLSYSEYLIWALYFEAIALKFPELADEFKENGII